MYKIETILKSLICIVLFFLFINIPALPGESGKIKGKITDASSGETLPGATVIIKGTSIGNATDFEGKFIITQAPAGKQIIQVSYVGYKSKEVPVSVIPGKTAEINVQLVYNSVDMKEIVVTAQLEGQSQAINQQLSSNTIVNVVSKDKIEELPDQNAAETLGRLPGIALQRANGEGQKVVIRGLSPRFSSITINGTQVPSTSQPGGFNKEVSVGGDADDRSVDLSMISPDVLEGIEVFKALRPDLDGDAIGGTVNFTTRKAMEGARTSIRMFGGYNDLEKDYRNYRGSFSYSNRFLKDADGASRLGVVVSGSVQRANRASYGVSGAYNWVGETDGQPIYQTADVALTKHNEIRKRYGLNLTLDYNLAENQDIFFTSLWAGTKQDSKEQTHNYDVSSWYHNRDFFEREVNLSTWSNSLSGKHMIWNTQVNWSASYSLSKENTPWAAYADFQESSAFSKDLPINNLAPEQVSHYALNDPYAAFLNESYIQTENVREENVTANLDIQHPIVINDDISGYIKAGAKIRDKNRDKDIDQFGGLRWYTGEPIMSSAAGQYIPASKSSADIALANFLCPSRTMDFLSGYSYVELLNQDALHTFTQKWKGIYEKTKNYKKDVEDYTAGEDVAAGYFMTELNWKQIVTVLPGFRYEHTATSYSTKVANPNTATLLVGRSISDSLGSRNYGNFLPMAQMKIKPVDWMDLRLSATKSLARPSFLNLIPYEIVDFDQLKLQYGNPNLKETRASNYDIYLSLYDSKWGLFTIGRYYKRLYDVDYVQTKLMTGGYYSSYLTNLKGWTVTSPQNLSDVTTVNGWEFELQTNFTFLPSPFDGIILYANFSLIHSETLYPYTVYTTTKLNHAPWIQTTATDLKRAGRLIGQPDRIANVTLGYEKGGFSGRFSVIYQGSALAGIGASDATDALTDSFFRLDLVVEQKIWQNLSFIIQANNLTNQQEKSFIRYNSFTTSTIAYGTTIDCGIQFKF